MYLIINILKFLVIVSIIYLIKILIGETNYINFLGYSISIILLLVLFNFIEWLLYFIRYKLLDFLKSYTFKEQKTENLVNNKAIYNIVEDKLFIKKDINNIEKILNEDINALLLNGKWGDGKTSLYNILKENIKNDFQIYDFNPWYISVEKNIITSFLEGLKRKFPFLKNNTDELIDVLVKKEKKLLLFNALFKENSIEEIKNKINNQFNHKKLLIVIDDLDRLESKERVFEILKLIGEFENYGNIKFLLLFDKVEIEKLINSNGYLEKIIQYTYNLKIKKEKVISFFDEEIHKIVTNNSLNNVKSYFGGIHDYKHYHISSGMYIYNIINLRHCKSLINIFKIKFRLLQNEVNTEQLFELCVLEVFYEDIYKNIFNNGKSLYTLTYGFSLSSYNDKGLNDIIKGNIDRLTINYNKDEKDYILSILYRLFPRIKGAYGTNIPQKSSSPVWLRERNIEDNSYFEKYFLEEISDNISDEILFKYLQGFDDLSENEKLTFLYNEYKNDGFYRITGHINQLDDNNKMLDFIEKSINNNKFKYDEGYSFFYKLSTLIQLIINEEFHSDYEERKGREKRKEKDKKKLSIYTKIILNSENILFLITFVYHYIEKSSWNEENYKEFYNKLKELLKNKILKIQKEGGNIFYLVEEGDKKYFEYTDVGLPFILGDDGLIGKKVC